MKKDLECKRDKTGSGLSEVESLYLEELEYATGIMNSRAVYSHNEGAALLLMQQNKKGGQGDGEAQ